MNGPGGKVEATEERGMKKEQKQEGAKGKMQK